MTKNRSSTNIIVDILHACASGSLSTTRILYKANLAWYQGKQYIHELVANDLLASDTEDCYFTTDKGFEWLAYEEKQSQLLIVAS